MCLEEATKINMANDSAAVMSSGKSFHISISLNVRNSIINIISTTIYTLLVKEALESDHCPRPRSTNCAVNSVVINRTRPRKVYRKLSSEIILMICLD